MLLLKTLQSSGNISRKVYSASIEKDLPGSARPLTDKSASMQRPDKSSAIKIADLRNFVKESAAAVVSGDPTNKRPGILRFRGCLVTRRGFEPRTHCLKGSCSAN